MTNSAPAGLERVQLVPRWAETMNAGTHPKQVLLFFAAVLLPCLVLVALTLGLASQQKEPSQKLETEDGQNSLREILERLLARLEAVESRGLDELAARRRFGFFPTSRRP